MHVFFDLTSKECAAQGCQPVSVSLVGTKMEHVYKESYIYFNEWNISVGFMAMQIDWENTIMFV